MISELKDKTHKLVTELQEDMNKQLKENSNKEMKEIKIMQYMNEEISKY
jgi:hypothetical protein